MNNADPLNVVPPNAPDFIVVGLGASAGGIAALQLFFANVPANSGMAYVVILHLLSDHDSQLASILQAVAPIPVTQVTRRVAVEPNHVYVIPPDQHLMMMDGSLAVLPNTLIEERRAPVDIFFRTLADSHGPKAVCVVLSGTGANGSMGLKRVKERGGAAFVQNPREADFHEMPRNAIATDLVDDVLPVAAMPARIMAYAASLGTVAIPVEALQRPDAEQQALREVFTQLRVRTGHDFSNYKRPTLLRRIERRITVRGLPNLPAYATFSREHDEETQALLKDLLISVTNFFRDRAAFEALDQECIPRLMLAKHTEDHVRVWVAGCATGEEAYSIAMLLAERTLGVFDAPKVQIFATDIDETAISRAREGLYSLNDAADVSPERLRRFFTREGDNYRIRREIREMVLFATHNVLKDPPFFHIDLVTCRNVLIYLNDTAQERVMETFHFALNPGGYLFLGTSESADSASDRYAVVSRDYHLFQSRHTGARSYPIPESVSTFRIELPPVILPTIEQEQRTLERFSYGDLHQRLLEQYAPPSIVVNEAYDIVHISERAGRYLQIAGGEPSTNLLKLIRPELRLELRTALYQALQRQTNVEAHYLTLRIDDRMESINILVRPVLGQEDTARGFLLILFEPSADTPSDSEIVFHPDEPVARQLEEELIRVKAQLRLSNEQHDIHTEELKAANEELQALNEELRSAAEELETSKEELQSINEELRTVNQELKVKIEETTLTSNNLQNLVNSTDIGTIFLDRGFRINLFTPATRALFNLISADIGRPLTDITHRLVGVDVLADAESVLDSLRVIEREVFTIDQRIFLMRLLPYRTAEDRINGVVITFLDVTQRHQAQNALRQSEARLQLALEAGGMGTFLWHVAEDRGEPDARMLALFGQPPDGTLNLRDALTTVVHPDDRARYVEAIAHASDPNGDGMLRIDTRVLHPNGSLHWIALTAQAVFAGEPPHPTVMYGLATDISERKRAEEQQLYLLTLSDELRSFSDPGDIQARVTQTALHYFGADRCYYCELEDGNARIQRDASREDLPSIAGVYPLSSFAILQAVVDAGRPFVVEDVRTADAIDEEFRQLCIELQVISYINVPMMKNEKPIGVLCIVQSTPRNWTDFEVELAVETAERTWVAVERVRAEEALQQAHVVLEQRVQERTIALAEANEARKILLQRLITAQEEERQRISRELHDSLGQSLVALSIRLDALHSNTEHLPTITTAIADMRRVAGTIDTELDRLTMELRPLTLSDLGLEEALRSYIEDWTTTSSVPVDLVVRGLSAERLPAETETTVYRIVQEALTNILKYAQATQVSIILERRSEQFRVIVEDDGIGFDLEAVRRERQGGRQIGLVGMNERAALAGGTLTIDTEPGSGTTIYLHIPLQE